MSGMYDEMREAPDPRQAEELRHRLLAALGTGSEAEGSPVSPVENDRDWRGDDSSAPGPQPSVASRWSRLRLTAVAASLVLVVGGLIAVSNLRDEQPPAPASPVPTAIPDPVAEPLPDTLSFAPPGFYEFDELGTPVTFSNPVEYLSVLRAPGAVVFIEWESSEPLPSPGDPLRSINFERVGSWYSAEEAIDSNFAGLGSFGPNDIDAWIADNPVIVDRFPDTTVGGRSARVFDARPDPDAGVTGECLESFKPCVWVSTLSSAVIDDVGHHDPNYALGSGFVSRFWLVDMGEFEPILIKISAPENDTAWFDEFASTVLPTIEFGEPQALTR